TAVSAMITATGEPLLAHWNAGLGRVAAWTSDAHHWAEAWVGWPGYRRLWVQITRLIARSDAARGAELAAEFVNGRLHVRLDMSGHSGEPLDLLAVPARVFAPTGRTVQTRLAQTAPGTYEGSIPAPESGVYTIMLTPRHGERRLMPVLGGAARQSGVEYQRLRSDLALLEDLARTTGGEVYDLAAGLSQTGAPDLFARRAARPGEARAPLWRLLLPWTLAVMLLDVATRRIAWDRFVSRQFGADRRRAVADALRDRGLQAAGTLERLRAGGRSDAGTGPTGTALTPDDARRVALEASRRRRERAIAPRPAATQGPGPQGPERPASPPSDAGAALRAAKHRARQRMEGEPGT
ncbi:MAG TPA: hypothetical protein VD963_07730, partial [Phycisphaerales bacterium]|nr:hypothetical protein [Phycisphaerales bacterium]